MAFGRSRKTEEPPVEPVAWADVRTFVVSSEEKPVTVKRKKGVRGPRAVRVPKGGKDFRVNAPCAYLAPASRAGDGPSATGLTLYEDPEARQLLCYVDEAREVDGERHHVVRDGQGGVLGTLRRIPPRRPFRHTWRIDQPGHPEIVGRNEWAAGDSAKDAVGRVAVKAAIGLVGALADFGAEGGDQPSRPRTLEWTVDGEVVMVSEGSAQVTVKADWVDRRLAFAFALVGDR
ncbi:hypothetical protein [Streptomyces laculatispora]|uniref:hypothetical protein n=1 Tax=Streptomyces laculatispora TaxID=887464 RepID=UPI001A94015E|nr:hypothetical protein [Streptomyces laculatispora]MBO0917173.1 hypothetical protein [Streptomyces laculatispora]